MTLRASAVASWRYELVAYISTGDPLEAAEKSHNIRRYFGEKRAKGQGTRRAFALADAIPEGCASDERGGGTRWGGRSEAPR